MSITKNKLVRKFTTIPNAIITDLNVCAQALRIYLYLLSKPDGWKVNNQDIQTQLGIKSPETMAKCWKSLIEFGWITRQRIVDDKGRISGGYDYELNDKAVLPESPNEEKTHIRKKPILGKNPNQEKTMPIINTEINRINTESNINISPYPLKGERDDDKPVEVNFDQSHEKTLKLMQENAFKTWQQISQECGFKFTEQEWFCIKAYAACKVNMHPHQIKMQMALLNKWALDGLDIVDSLLKSGSTKTLVTPPMKKSTDLRGNLIYGNGEILTKSRNKDLIDLPQGAN